MPSLPLTTSSRQPSVTLPATSACQGCCCLSPAISACCKITRVRQTPRDPCPEEQTGPAAGVRQVPSSPRWVPGVSSAVGEDGPGDAEGRPMPSGVRRRQAARGQRGFGQGHAESAWDAGTGDAEFGSSPTRHGGVRVNPSEDISAPHRLKDIKHFAL